MKWNTPLSRSAAAALIVTLGVTGCHEWPNVFVDDLPRASAATTASMERAMHAGTTDVRPTRDFAPVQVEAQDGTVPHGPLWFEDPVEMAGSEDGRFAITREDYVSGVYSMGRFVVNVLLIPFSAGIDLPGSMVCSDGIERRSRISWLPEPYDAERCSGVAEPIDILEMWTVPVPVSDAEEDATPGEETDE